MLRRRQPRSITTSIAKYTLPYAKGDMIVDFHAHAEPGDDGDYYTPPTPPSIECYGAHVRAIITATGEITRDQMPDWFALADRIASKMLESGVDGVYDDVAERLSGWDDE